MTLQTEELRKAWTALFPDKPPDDAQWSLWEFLHEPTTVRSAIGQLAVRYRKLSGMSLDHMVRFASAVMNRLEREQHHGNTPTTPDGLCAVPVPHMEGDHELRKTHQQ